RFANQQINTILGIKNPLFGRLKPDLVDVYTQEVYEIKPAGRFSQGVIEVNGYITTLTSLDPQRRRWIPGSTYIPPFVVQVHIGVYAFVFPPEGGVILYQICDFRPLFAVVTAALSLEIYDSLRRAFPSFGGLVLA